MEKFKRTIVFLMVAIIISSTLFTSCKKDDEFNVEENLIQHTWKMTEINANDETVESMFNMMLLVVTMTYDFNEDGTFVFTVVAPGNNDAYDGTWSINDEYTELTLNEEVVEIQEASKLILKIGAIGSIIQGMPTEEEVLTTDYSMVFEADY